MRICLDIINLCFILYYLTTIKVFHGFIDYSKDMINKLCSCFRSMKKVNNIIDCSYYLFCWLTGSAKCFSRISSYTFHKKTIIEFDMDILVLVLKLKPHLLTFIGPFLSNKFLKYMFRFTRYSKQLLILVNKHEI